MDAGIGQFIPLILIFVIFYFFLIRPQQKKVKEHKLMVEGLKRGDKVITTGGIVGTVERVIDNDMFVSLLATFGLSLFLQQVMNLIYGPEVQTIDSKFPIATMFDSFVTVPMAKVVSLLQLALLLDLLMLV